MYFSLIKASSSGISSSGSSIAGDSSAESRLLRRSELLPEELAGDSREHRLGSRMAHSTTDISEHSGEPAMMSFFSSGHPAATSGSSRLRHLAGVGGAAATLGETGALADVDVLRRKDGRHWPIAESSCALSPSFAAAASSIFR